MIFSQHRSHITQSDAGPCRWSPRPYSCRVRSCAIISVLALVPVVAACGSSGAATEGGAPVDATGGDAASVMDAAEAEVTDPPFCRRSLDAWCAMPNAGCVRDWASGVHAAVDGGPGCLVEVCGGYDVLAMYSGPYGVENYYDRVTGQLVAVVGFNKYEVCLGGPPGFARPSNCSSMSACDSLPDAGDAALIGGDGATDAPSDAMDSGGE
jgi:hypothetical protein